MMDDRLPQGPEARSTVDAEAPMPGLADPRALQVLATEHWSLLATRSLAWNETFSRAGMFLTALSGAIVALALVAQATAFGEGFVAFAFVLLPFVLFVGITTYVRLLQSNAEDIQCTRGMNRLRHAYFELIPGLAPYFVTGSHDDLAGLMVTWGAPTAVAGSKDRSALEETVSGGLPRRGLLHGLVTTSGMIGVITALIGGVLVALVSLQLGATTSAAIVAGAIGFVLVFGALVSYAVRTAFAAMRTLPVLFPTPPGPTPPTGSLTSQ